MKAKCATSKATTKRKTKTKAKAAPKGGAQIIRIVRSRSGRELRSYDGAATGSRLDNWLATGTDANEEIRQSLARLRNRCRDLVRNSPYGARAMTALTGNMLGTGLRPSLATGDEALNKRATDLWDAWGRVCYTSSPLGIYGLQTLIARSLFESGECLVRARYLPSTEMPGLPKLMIQVLEGDLMPIEKSDGTGTIGGSKAIGNNVIRHGVEFDALDRRVAYHLYTEHPGASMSWGSMASYGQTVRIPAADMLHLYQETRPGQVRGVPWLAPVVIALWDADGYADSERVRAKAASCLIAIVEGGDPEATVGGVDGIADATDSTGTLIEDSEGNPVEQLRPGLIAQCPPGKTIKFLSPQPASGYESTRRCDLRDIAAGAQLSYEVLTGDLSQQNFAAIRLGLNEQTRVLRVLREQVFAPFVMDTIWSWFADAAFTAGLLPNDPTLRRVTWSNPQQQAIDRKADVEAAQASMRAGLTSLPEEIAATGKDYEDAMALRAKDIAQRDKLGIVLDSDPRQTSSGGQVQTTWGAEEEPQAEEPAEEPTEEEPVA